MVAVISGGMGDIAYAVAVAFAQAGVDIALSDVVAADPSKLAALGEYGVAVSYSRVDVTDAAAVDAWLDLIEEPTIVVPAAAVVSDSPLLEITPATWSRELEVDLTGPYLLATAAARRMVVAGTPGNIVFIGSWAADRPHPNIAPYSVAKAGLRMLMKCMASDLAPEGIRVNEVAPGYVDAGLSRGIFDREPSRRDAAVQEVPLGGLASPSDVAELVTFLCSPAAAQVTGATLLADGGLSLQR